MKNLIERTKNFCGSKVNKLQLLIMSAYMTVMCNSVAYAKAGDADAAGAAVQEQLTNLVDTGLDYFFIFVCGGGGLFGIFILIRGIFSYVKAMNDADSRQSGEASNDITKGLVTIIVAIATFAFKGTISELLHSMF